MRVLGAVAVSALGLLAVSSAQAQEASAPRANVEAIALKDPNRVVCASLYHEGTLIRRPLCKSAEEWYADRQRTRQDITDLQLRKLEIGR